LKDNPKSYSGETWRDMLLLREGRNRVLVVTCDSAGGIGSKSHDKITANPQLVGKMTARVALMELLSTGTDPVALVATLSVEPKPTANLLIQGVKEELRSARFGNIPILCSSEKNVRVSQTGLGITTFGFASRTRLKVGRVEPNDEIIAVGEPYVGKEVIRAERKGQIADTLDVLKLRRQSFVHELIPVGSRGTLYEARGVAKHSGLIFKPSHPQTFNLKKSAGPATALLCLVSEGSLAEVKRILGTKPITKIGKLRER